MEPTPAPTHALHLLYHELRSEKTDYSYVVRTADFEEHLDLFARLRNSARQQVWPEITFDDGHLSNYEHAFPLLHARGLLARFFITVGWTGQRSGYMGWSELRALHQAGHTIGAHGWTHTLLTHCSPSVLNVELRNPRLALEDKLGTSITSMSLPGGRFNASVLLACEQAGYTEIFTSIPRSEPLPLGSILGRLNIVGGTKLPWLSAALQPESRLLAGLERSYRRKAAAKALLGDRIYAKLWALLNREEAVTDLPTP